MWFKNIQIYRLGAGWAMTPGALEEILSAKPLLPCVGMATISKGWVSPRNDAQIVASFEKHILVALGVETKLLPASVVNQEAADRLVEIEQKQGYKPSKKQVREIKERITAELLPRAFAKRRVTRAWINPSEHWLIVDASSPGRAEELLEHLRDTLGELPTTLLDTQMSPQGAMTQWLTVGQAAGEFMLDQDCELKGSDEQAATVRYVRHDLGVEDLKKHISTGKSATKLGLTWRDRIALLLAEPLQVKRLKYLAMEKNSDDGNASLSKDEQFDADFALMAGEISKLLADLVSALGGEKAD